MTQFKVQSEALQRALKPLLEEPGYIQTIVHHATDDVNGLRLEVEYRNTRLEVMDPKKVRFKRVKLE